jgi:hypothetical protein
LAVIKKHKFEYQKKEYGYGWYFREYKFSEKLKTTDNIPYK